MPHHSGQQRQISAGTLSPQPVLHSTTFSMPHSASLSSQPSGFVSQPGPLPHQADMHRHLYHAPQSSWRGSPHSTVHRVGSLADGDASVGSHHQTNYVQPHLTPTRHLSHSQSKSFDSPHGVAASVLLLAASKIREDEEASSPTPATTTLSPGTPAAQRSTTPSSVDPSPNVPIKKRKTPADIMRKKLNEEPTHVSPMSHPSASPSIASVAGTPESIGRRSSHDQGSPTTPSSSYELKAGQALPDSAKILDTRQISYPPAQLEEIPHFPAILHAVLTESEFADSVLQWLAHGQAWRIVRWDALRRQVLPKYFTKPNASDSTKDASSGLSVDAFLWQLQAWGFQEVTSGTDAGAYTNVLFRRELPQLCREMRFCPPSEKPEKKLGDCEVARSILRVPSLSCHGLDRGTGEEKKEDEHSSHHHLVAPSWRSSNISYRPSHPMMHRHNMWNAYSPGQPQWVRMESPHGHSQDSNRAVPPYSPIRVRSSRGAARIAYASTKRPDHHLSSPDMMANRVGFPVSNRGRNGPAARRLSVSSQASSVEPSTIEPPKHRPLLKRKLPITSRVVKDEALSDSDTCASSDNETKRCKIDLIPEHETAAN